MCATNLPVKLSFDKNPLRFEKKSISFFWKNIAQGDKYEKAFSEVAKKWHFDFACIFWDCDSYKELLRRFCVYALFCTFGKLGKLCFFWCYCDPWYVRFKLTLEGFKVIIVSFWIKKKLLCTPFESDFQRSFYVISNTI